MGYKAKSIILPREPNVYWTFMVSKLLLQIVLIVYAVFVVTWTFYTMKFYKQKIVELNEANPYGGVKSPSETIRYILSTRETQKLSTHTHFFLFTGLFLLGSSVIGLLGVAKELVSMLFGFIIMQAMSFAFEYVGAVKSNDESVVQFKKVSMSVQPLLILLTGMFILMVRRLEVKMSTQPAYRQTIIGGLPGNFGGNPALKLSPPSSGGQVNLAMNLDD